MTREVPRGQVVRESQILVITLLRFPSDPEASVCRAALHQQRTVIPLELVCEESAGIHTRTHRCVREGRSLAPPRPRPVETPVAPPAAGFERSHVSTLSNDCFILRSSISVTAAAPCCVTWFHESFDGLHPRGQVRSSFENQRFLSSFENRRFPSDPSHSACSACRETAEAPSVSQSEATTPGRNHKWIYITGQSPVGD
jgi:hypothetical protein